MCLDPLDPNDEERRIYPPAAAPNLIPLSASHGVNLVDGLGRGPLQRNRLRSPDAVPHFNSPRSIVRSDDAESTTPPC